MLRYFRQGPPAAALFFSLFIVAGCSGDIEETVREPVVRPVKLLTLEAASDLQTSRYPAIVSAGRFGELSFQVSGLVEEVAVVDAQEVSAGDLIARLDQRDFISKVTSARSQFQNADAEYQRAQRLAKEDAIAKSVLQQRESQRDVARAQLDSAEKALEDSILLAPFNGVVAQIPVRERETVVSGQLVAALIDTEMLEVTIDVPSRVVAQSLEVEDRGSVVILEAAPDTRIVATFKEANLLADTVSQTYAVTYRFEPPSNLVILPGMSATVELSSARLADASARPRKSVPISAISSDGTATYVWVVNPDSMAVSKREITVAEGVGEYAVVTEGLAAGETIATAGASFLAEGMQIRPWED
jgi:RND family efflux transporter MFP subunit